MRTSGPKPGQLAAMVIFAFSCFGLLLFLWLSFGGPIPLEPKGYRFEVGFPEATTLAVQADVRVAGVSVGKVAKLERDPAGNRTLATIQLERRYAPLHTDARAILRQKTLLGETYVELTLGKKGTPYVKEGGRLANSRVEPTVELDEVLQVFPAQTRAAFRRWMANASQTIDGRGRDFNDALGNVAGFADHGADLLDVLDRRRETLGNLVAQTGSVFEALTRDEGQLRAFIADTARWFGATASQKQALADSIQILPTFLRESRATLSRLERFSIHAKPLIDDLGPAAHDLKPTLADLRRASPDLETAFGSLPSLVAASRNGLPAFSRVLRGLTPVLAATGPFLSELNPILEWLQLKQWTVADFIATPGHAIEGRATTTNPQGQGHVLPQLIVTGSQTLVTPTRSSDNRGNTYLAPDALDYARYKQGFNVYPNWDCSAAGGEHQASARNPGCYVQGPIPFQGLSLRFPHVRASGEK